jgi:hypothetical protein
MRFLKNAPGGRHGVRQLAAALDCLADISGTFEGESLLAPLGYAHFSQIRDKLAVEGGSKLPHSKAPSARD